MVPVAVPPTEASIFTFFKGAGPEEGVAVTETERVLSVTVQPEGHWYPVSPTLFIQVDGFDGVDAEQVPSH
ncbi:MAG: hypothetical protein A2842_02495 [Candidatus Wildermuthbacteria bacterium RIFCSPHIGHO2_01_FULL_48_25]|uniref:Uncharacterized protein n=1 Tax=Candidatus Wildermuthbacteria bacterium RIFCSPLOWO2_01_FULL_48_16 TaxID=1802461 RepID=A0A1G2RKT0_9BACT|nr:MAG: hypothetical protein A2842_02495 [Candidatus Wildermuthbacteria bacterium RIFCSPHIGHO2_01_FULL_48_25]OHA72902.1 MAG: hypothetical protein A3B24_03345 [Candidatus Wildermuthbacteria bacterium RIFCSPLOWO2_01_FULL_48_16]